MSSERQTRVPQEIEMLLAPVFQRAEYRQFSISVDVSVYKALWSTNDVEHFIYLSQYLKDGRTRFNPEFGIKNPPAEVFGIDSIRKYGGDLFKNWPHIVTTSYTMGCSFGRLEPGGWRLSNQQ